MHPHDKAWVTAQLMRLPVELRGRIAELYAIEYRQAYDAEPVEHRKEGRARFAANTRLREYVEKVTKKNCTGEA
jgi:hypothetical protein